MSATVESITMARAAAAAAADKLAEQIVAFDVSEQLSIADIFILCSAPNERQVGAIVDGIEERLRALGAKPAHREGDRDYRWVLLDYLDLVVHVQHDEERVFYSLERLWRDCPVVDLEVNVEPASTVTS